MLKGLRCKYLDGGFDFEPEALCYCCQTSHKGGGKPIITDNYSGEILDWNEVFSQRRVFRDALLNGEVPEKCEGCTFIEPINDTSSINEGDYFSEIMINHFFECNSMCCYCSKRLSSNNKNGCISDYSILPVLKDLFEKNLIKKDACIAFAGGEPTIFKGFDEILNLSYENGLRNFVIHSSCIKYSDAIEKGLRLLKDIRVVVSLDSGTRETYKKIKNVDCFDKVCENLKKYVSFANSHNDLICSKYIIIPGINDNFEEINTWYNLSTKNIGIKSLIIDIEQDWFGINNDKIPAYMVDLIKHVESLAKRDNIGFSLYERAKLLFI